VGKFLAWAAGQQLELHRVTTGLVGQYFDQLAGSIPTRKTAPGGAPRLL
jgi:hypothetical protein